MQYRNLDLNLLSAYNLPNVRSKMRVYAGLATMKVYAVVSYPGTAIKETQPDNQGGENPTWNETVTYNNIPDSDLLEESGREIVIKLLCQRTMNTPKYVGEVHLKIKQLYDAASEKGGNAMLSFPVVRTEDGGSEEEESQQGELNLWCKFGKPGDLKSASSELTHGQVVMAGFMEAVRLFVRNKMRLN